MDTLKLDDELTDVRADVELARTVEYVKDKMRGVRNDKVTPEWQHPLDVLALFHKMCNEVGRLDRWRGEYLFVEQVCLLHDIVEDGFNWKPAKFSWQGPKIVENVTFGQLAYDGFNNQLIETVRLLTKPDSCKPSALTGYMQLIRYFGRLLDATPEQARVVKVLDRIANLFEAVGVFKQSRLTRYIWESQVLVMGLAQNIEDPWGHWLRIELQRSIDHAKTTLL